MLKIKLINDLAALNNFYYVETKEYTADLPFVIKLQVYDAQSGIRLIPSTTAKLVATFQNRDGTELVKAGVMLFNPDDRSLWSVSLTKAEALEIVGSNFQVDLDFNGSSAASDLSDSTDLRVGMAYSVISKITFDGEC